MTKAEIILKFHLYMDDTTELSSQEESDLFDKKYQMICGLKPWEFLKTQGTGTQSTTVPYVALPSDFSYFSPNHNYTGDNTYGEFPVIFVGSGYSPCQIVNFSDRRQYRNQGNSAYLDMANSRIVFTLQPTIANAIEFDYIKVPANLLTTESPIFPARFHDIIYHAMCTDQFVIDQSDKAKSYRAENQGLYDSYLEDLSMWNANNIQM